MPHRIYRGSEPPKWWDPILAHPWELATATYGIVGGILALLKLLDGRDVSESTAHLPTALTATMLVLLVAGGALMWAGLLDRSPDLMRGWTLERAGLAATAGGWGIYTLTIVAAYPGSMLGWGVGGTFTLATALRLAATYSEEWTTRELIR